MFVAFEKYDILSLYCKSIFWGWKSSFFLVGELNGQQRIYLYFPFFLGQGHQRVKKNIFIFFSFLVSDRGLNNFQIGHFSGKFKLVIFQGNETHFFNKIRPLRQFFLSCFLT
eukprot:TRINITY_DN16965_c0_g1_i6.p5 TRINITY_DN16965_c0_g1~~TRINITY_DN16965_c0_g1_i6.p5  ORF type:complete len:112 (+),score=0.21 TRINITY_DN16965_c0_g1_i6:166-501(+)